MKKYFDTQDHGWAWMIVLSNFIFHVIMPGFYVMFSVFLLDFADRYHSSVALISLLPAFFGIAFCLSTHFATAIIPQKSIKKTCFVCSLINCGLTVMIGYSNSMLVLSVCLVAKTLAHGMIVVPAFTLIASWFESRKALASSLTVSGISVSAVLIPPLFRHLSGSYGFSGCFLLISGFEMHGLIASMLLRLPRLEVFSENLFPNDYHVSNDPETYCHSSTIDANKNMYDKISVKNQKQEIINTDTENIELTSGVDNNFTESSDNHKAGEEKLILETKRNQSIKEIDSSDLSLQSSLKAEEDKITDVIDLDFDKENNDLELTHLVHNINKQIPKSSPTISRESLASYSTGNNIVPLTLSQVSINYISNTSRHLSAGSKNKLQTHDTKLSNVGKYLKILFDFSYLKDKTILVMAFCYSVAFSTTFISSYLPAHAEYSGVTKFKAAMLITIYGVVDMATRNVYGYFTDLKLVPVTFVSAITSFVAGTVCQFMPLMDTFGSLVAFSVIAGGFGFAPQVMFPVMAMEVGGVNRLGHVLSAGVIIQSILQAAFYALMGVVIKTTEEFTTTFHITGGLYFINILLMWIVHRFYRKQ